MSLLLQEATAAAVAVAEEKRASPSAQLAIHYMYVCLLLSQPCALLISNDDSRPSPVRILDVCMCSLSVCGCLFAFHGRLGANVLARRRYQALEFRFFFCHHHQQQQQLTDYRLQITDRQPLVLQTCSADTAAVSTADFVLFFFSILSIIASQGLCTPGRAPMKKKTLLENIYHM